MGENGQAAQGYKLTENAWCTQGSIKFYCSNKKIVKEPHNSCYLHIQRELFYPLVAFFFKE